MLSLKEKEWKEFRVEDLFSNLPQSKKVTKRELTDNGKIPAYSSDSTNNGCVGYVEIEPTYKTSKEVPTYIIFGDHTKTINIVQHDFCILDNVKVLQPKITLSNEILLFIKTSWYKSIPNLGYARHWSRAKKAPILLPITTDGQPDWQFMEDYIKELEAERIKELEAYLVATGLDNYELTDVDFEVLNCEIEWQEFQIGKLFEIKKGKRLTKANMIDGNIPFIGATSYNNGLTNYIGNITHIHEANTISVTYNGSVGEAFLQEKPYWASDDVNVWYPKFKYSREVCLYFIALIKKLGSRYEYSHKWTLNQMLDEMIQLPTTSAGEPDWQYMEDYIRAIEKQTIADVIKYKDKVIEMTKEIVN